MLVEFRVAEIFVLADFAPEILQRGNCVPGGQIDDERQDASALDVAQEAKPETFVQMSIFHEPWYVGHCEGRAWRLTLKTRADERAAGIVVEDDGAERWGESGESPVSHASATVGEGAEESGFASVGVTNKTNVGKELEFKLKFYSHAKLTFGGKLGFGFGFAGKMWVSEATDGASGKEEGC